MSYENEPGQSQHRPEPAAGWTDRVQWATNLSTSELAFRDQFVEEFLVDRDGYAACLRMGLASGPSYQYSQQLLNDAYVQHKLALHTYKKKDPEESDQAKRHIEEQTTRNMIIEGLKREAFNHGPGSKQSARVAALSKLAALYGMDKASQLDDENDKPKGGVMMMPVMLSENQWENLAAASQKKLAEESARDVEES